MKLEKQLTAVVRVSFDTDNFTREEWLAFIKAYVGPRDIERAIKGDLFPFETLKEKAIAGYQLVEEGLSL